MYLFSLWNNANKIQDTNNILHFLKEKKTFTLELLWGKISENENINAEENYGYIIEKKYKNKNKKFIKYNDFIQCIDPSIEPFLKNYFMTIQTQTFIEALYENDNENSLLLFRFFSSNDCKDLCTFTRQGIESERCITQFLYGCSQYICIEKINTLDTLETKQNNMQVESTDTLSVLQKNIHKKIEWNCFPQANSSVYLNIEKGEFTNFSKYMSWKRKGYCIFYENLSTVRHIILNSFTKNTNIEIQNVQNVQFQSKLIFCKKENIQKWKDELQTFENITYIEITKQEDFDLLTFSFLSQENTYVILDKDLFSSSFTFLCETVEETRESFESLINQNSFVTIKNIPLCHTMGVSLELIKKIFLAQDKKFPLQSVPFLWIQFKIVVYDIFESSDNVLDIHEEENARTKETLEFYITHIQSSINFFCVPIEGKAFTKQTTFFLHPFLWNIFPMKLFFDDIYDNISSTIEENFLYKIWGHSFVNENSLVFPVSPHILQKILPLQLYFNMNEEEKKFLQCLEDIYDFITKGGQNLFVPNANKIAAKDILIPFSQSDFPLNMYEILKRIKSVFTSTSAIENCKNQLWKNKNAWKGNTVLDIFAKWKFGSSIHPNALYEEVFQDISSQPVCYICSENKPQLFSVCAHGFCKECLKQYESIETLQKKEDVSTPILPCPICRKLLTPYDWFYITQDSQEKIISVTPTKLEKLYLHILNQKEKENQKKICILVPTNTKQIFFDFLIHLEGYDCIDIQMFLEREEEMKHPEKQWICILEENIFQNTNLHTNIHTNIQMNIQMNMKMNMDILYCISPTLQTFSKYYPFILANIGERAHFIIMMVISDHPQEESQLLKIIETFFTF